VYILCIYMIFFEWDEIVHLVGHFK
jgi:hypothetical protein